MHKLPHKVADSQGDFYFPDQIPNPSMDMILSERICGSYFVGRLIEVTRGGSKI